MPSAFKYCLLFVQVEVKFVFNDLLFNNKYDLLICYFIDVGYFTQICNIRYKLDVVAFCHRIRDLVYTSLVGILLGNVK